MPDTTQMLRALPPMLSGEQLKQEREMAGIVSNAITLTSFPHVNVYI